jgi:signal transduction histidine kinase
MTPPSVRVVASPHTEDHAKTRTEQIIAGARMTLVVAALVTLSLDSTQPARYEETYLALALYVLYAVALGVFAWRGYVPSRRMLLAIHGVDLVAPSVLVAVFDGPPISPFFVFFVFSLFAATLRWNWRGTVWTGGCALVLFGVAGLVVSQFVLDELVYLAVVAGLLAYMGAWEQRRRTEVARLAAWPASVPADLRTAVTEALQHAASTLGVRRIVLAWEEEDEPGRYVASLAGDEFHFTQEPEQESCALIAVDIAESVFFCPDARLTPARVLIGSTGELTSHLAPIDRGFVARFAVGSVLSLPLASGEWEGQLFLLDKRRTTPDDMVLARIVGQQIAARLEHHYLVQRLQQSAIVQERLGFARDLHDGLLQALTGIALQVQTALGVMPTSPARARERLDEVQRQIRVAQQSLRSYIRDLKPRILFDDHASADLATRLRRLVGRLRREWDIDVDVDIPTVLAAGRAGIAYHIMHLVHEGIVNAVRHGRASTVSVTINEDARSLAIRIADNGCGFPFHGRHDLKSLQDMGAGPATLKDRVAALRGTIVVDSGAGGSRIEMTIPLASVTDPSAEPLKRPAGA